MSPLDLTLFLLEKTSMRVCQDSEVRSIPPLFLFQSKQYQGLRVGQVRAIFQLPKTLGSYPDPVLYIQWFTPLRKIDEDTQMYRVERSSHNKAQNSSIIPITQVSRTCHLIPYSGKAHEHRWTSETVLEQCHSFHLNPYLRLSDYVLLRLRDHGL